MKPGHKSQHRDAAWREYHRTWLKANRQRYLDYQRSWREANREHKNEYNREYHRANPEIKKQGKRKRRAQRRAVPSEPWTREQVTELYGSACYICVTGPFEHTDHVIPIAGGGWDVLPNLRPACASCNSRKRDRMPSNLWQAWVWWAIDAASPVGETV